MKTEIVAQLRATGGGKGDRTKGGGKGTKGDKTSRRQRIQFKGCWHCGAENHSRRQCKEFEKLLIAANPGITDRKKMKLPPGYEGKYEKALKAAGIAPRAQRVAMLADEFHDDDDDSDFGEPDVFRGLNCGLLAGYTSSDDEFDFDVCTPCNDGDSG